MRMMGAVSGLERSIVRGAGRRVDCTIGVAFGAAAAFAAGAGSCAGTGGLYAGFGFAYLPTGFGFLLYLERLTAYVRDCGVNRRDGMGSRVHSLAPETPVRSNKDGIGAILKWHW